AVMPPAMAAEPVPALAAQGRNDASPQGDKRTAKSWHGTQDAADAGAERQPNGAGDRPHLWLRSRRPRHPSHLAGIARGAERVGDSREKHARSTSHGKALSFFRVILPSACRERSFPKKDPTWLIRLKRAMPRSMKSFPSLTASPPMPW